MTCVSVNWFIHQICGTSYNHMDLEVDCPPLIIHFFCYLFHTNVVTKHIHQHPPSSQPRNCARIYMRCERVPFAWTWLFHDGTAASIDLILIRYQFQPTTSLQQNRIFPLPLSCLAPQILSPHTPSALLSQNCLLRSFL